MVPSRVEDPTVLKPANVLARAPGVERVSAREYDPAILRVAHDPALTVEPGDDLPRSTEYRLSHHARSTTSADRASILTESMALRALAFLTYVSLVAST